MARTNPSVQKFRRVLKSMPPEIVKQARKAVSASGRDMAAAIRAQAPAGATLDLKRSVRSSTSGRLAVTVRAGGRLTTTSRGGDYALSMEFGREGQSAAPFFWPTYRRNRNAVLVSIHNAFTAALKQTWKE